MSRKLLFSYARHGARAAHRGALWVFFAALMGFVCVDDSESATTTVTLAQQARGNVRSGPRNVRIEIATQEVDSILWLAQWVQPQITGGGAGPDTYEVEWYAGPEAAPQAEPTRVVTVPGDQRRAWLWTDYACPDTLYVHVRARGHGEWREGSVTPWSEFATASFAQECQLPAMPPAPEVTVDTAQTDTTDVELQLQGAAWFPERDPPELAWSPWTTTIRTDPATGEVLEREVLHQCWYMASVYPDSVEYHWKTPAICPDVGFITEMELAVMPDSLVEVRCRGDGGAFTEWVRADQADLDCGGVVRWASAGGLP